MSTMPTTSHQTAAPPRGVALSGFVFSALFIFSVVITRRAIPADPADPGEWLADATVTSWLRFAMNLKPFTGVAFLWFMAVLRGRIGVREDRFFATVFLGSGLLFVALIFVASAIAQGLINNFANNASRAAQSETYAVGRAVVYTLVNTFAAKMAAVFIFVTSSIGLRTTFLPRWLAFIGFAVGLVLLLVITNFAWIVLLFPMWVLLVSAYILIADFRQEHQAATAP